MRTPYATFDLIDSPTLEERLDFFETGLREIAHHERLCTSRRPEFRDKWLWRSEVYFPHACDCWLSKPLGSVGLRLK